MKYAVMLALSFFLLLGVALLVACFVRALRRRGSGFAAVFLGLCAVFALDADKTTNRTERTENGEVGQSENGEWTMENDGVARSDTEILNSQFSNLNSPTVIEYHWGKDLSGTIGGAGGVGGLLYLKRNGVIYVPWYDAYGNVMGYWDAQGTVVAEYTYDAFGKLIASSGLLADTFSFRFSTKYFDPETDLYYYGYRYYKSEIMSWIAMDPIEEDGGNNLYAFCLNSPLFMVDPLGDIAVTDIPGIMDAKKWSVGAALMRHWLSLDSKVPTIPNETIVKMNWVLGFDRAKTVYDKIFSEKQYVNQAARKEIIAMIKRTLKGAEGTFCPLNRPASQVESDYVNTRPVGSVFDPLDDMLAALGRFNLRMAVSGYVKGKCAFVTSVGVYVRDSYDFVGDQSLGYWNSRTNYAGNLKGRQSIKCQFPRLCRENW